MLKLNDLYLMDCMDGMKEFPDGYFDLAVVDPPYGVGTVTYMPGRRRKATGGAFDTYNLTVATLDMNQRSKVKTDIVSGGGGHYTPTTKTHFGDENIAPPPEYFKELFRVSKNQLIFGGNYFVLPPSRGFVVWRKPGVTEGFSMAMCEYIWTSFSRNAKVVEANPFGRPGERFHPTQKPLKVYEFLLKHFGKPGDKVLDTHAGSATSLVACHNAGLEYIGFEKDDVYYKLAKERLDAVKAQASLDIKLNKEEGQS